MSTEEAAVMMLLLPYVAGFLAFLAVVVIVKRFNQGLVDRYAREAQDDSEMRGLASALRIGLERMSMPPPSGMAIFNSGFRLRGTYRGFPVEIVMAGGASLVAGVPYEVASSLKKVVTLSVPNPQHKAFALRPKRKEYVSSPTGNRVFDRALVLMGDRIISDALLQQLGGFGWMNLELRGGELIFRDTFFEDHASWTPWGGMRAAVMRHPMWGTSRWRPTLDVPRSVAFVDCLVSLAEEIVRLR